MSDNTSPIPVFTIENKMAIHEALMNRHVGEWNAFTPRTQLEEALIRIPFFIMGMRTGKPNLAYDGYSKKEREFIVGEDRNALLCVYATLMAQASPDVPYVLVPRDWENGFEWRPSRVIRDDREN